MSRERFPCGCVADGRAWLMQCPAHKAEHDAMHAEALAGFARANDEFDTQPVAAAE